MDTTWFNLCFVHPLSSPDYHLTVSPQDQPSSTSYQQKKQRRPRKGRRSSTLKFTLFPSSRSDTSKAIENLIVGATVESVFSEEPLPPSDYPSLVKPKRYTSRGLSSPASTQSSSSRITAPSHPSSPFGPYAGVFSPNAYDGAFAPLPPSAGGPGGGAHSTMHPSTFEPFRPPAPLRVGKLVNGEFIPSTKTSAESVSLPPASARFVFPLRTAPSPLPVLLHGLLQVPRCRHMFDKCK